MDTSIKKHFKKRKTLGKPQDSFVSRLSTDPYLDWFLIIIGATAVAIIGVIIGVFVYFNIMKELNSSDASQPVAKEVFDTDLLNKVLKRFADRADDRTRIKQGLGIPADPSL